MTTVRIALACVLLMACRSPSSPSSDDAAPSSDSILDGVPAGEFYLPPMNGKLDYQLGGAYPPPAGTEIVSRDRKDPIADGVYNICYVNGFQIQPDEESVWMTNYPQLILRDGNGNPVIDADWNEMLIDIRTPEKRAMVGTIVGEWIAQCSLDGYRAVEIDNLDSFTRSLGLLTEQNAVDMMRLFSTAAHQAHLAIAQKNSAELVTRKADLGTDFAVAEECNRYSECDVYMAGYGDRVYVIEYRQQDFTAGCAAFPNLSIVLRDLNLTTPSSSTYVYDDC